ncbi:MAG TPA: hypothetical protein VKE94_10695 [Gemmataceae bacterium]|nr:hypothetical protein [Gemmataceae bacterium]
MSRRVLSAVAVLLAVVAFVAAGEFKGKITKVDPDNNKFTMTVDEKDQEFTVTKDTKFTSAKGNEMKGALKSKAFSEKRLKEGVPATVVTEKVGDKEVVKEVKLMGGKKQADK